MRMRRVQNGAMEETMETLCVVACDSNLQKAEELEASLRRWKQRMQLASFSAASTRW